MKKIIGIAILIIMLSCSKDDEINDCGCVQSQEINKETTIYTGGAYMSFKSWKRSGRSRYFEGCFTESETEFMTVYLNDNERWIVTCNN
jgi:hypothetical protein